MNAIHSLRYTSVLLGALSALVLPIHVVSAAAPTDIALSAASIGENNAENATIGTVSAIDEDVDDTHAFSLDSGTGDTDNGSFTIDGADLKLIPSADFEAKSSYSVRLLADDGNGGTFAKALAITITNVNETPTDIALTATTIAENVAADSTVGSFSSTDPDAANTFTYSLVTGAGSTDNASFSISGDELTINASPNYEAKSSYAIRVRTTDQGGLSIEEPFTITITDVNEAPTDLALSANTLAENNAANATVGTLSTTDADAGDTFTYTLVSGDGSTDNASFSIDGSALKLTPVANYEAQSSYTVRVRSADAGGDYYEEAFTVAITDVNEAATDIALSLSSIAENNAADATVGTLSAIGDPDAGATHSFSFVSGTGDADNAAFTIDGSTLKIVDSADFETKSSYSLRVQADDGAGGTFAKALTVSITNVNEAPTDIALSSSTIAENVSDNSTVGTLSSTDPDTGDTFTYALVSGDGSTDNDAFNISGAALRLIDSPNYEAQSSYTVRVRTTDAGGAFTEEAFTVTITNVNEAPTDLELSASSVAENVPSASTVGSFSTTDPDAANTFTYTLVNGTGSTDNASFSITGDELSITASPNYEAKSSYAIRVRTTDQGGLFIEEPFTITITDENEAPTNIALNPSSFAENNGMGDAIGTLAAADPDAGNTHTFELVAGTGDTDNASFTLSTAGGLTINVATNYEVKSSYSIRVLATDNGLPERSFEKALTISVTDTNDAPTALALNSSTVNENAVSNTTVGTFSSTDEDTSDTFTYTLVSGAGDTDNASFNISNGTLRTSEAFDFEDGPTRSIRVRTTDAGGLTSEDEFTITVVDQNDAPTNITLSATAVDENDDPNTIVGTLSAADQDEDDTHTFALASGTGDDDNDSFSISGTNLIITPSANYEVKSSYSIRLRTTDSGTGGLTFDKAFVITINDVNEAPTDIALSAISIAENTASGSTVGLISGSDADDGQAATLVFSLAAGTGADDNANFVVDGNELNTTEAFDYEAQASYSIRLRATDTGGEFFEEAFTITITDANDAPIMTSNGGGATGTDSLAENTTAVSNVTATDADLPAQELTFSISGDDAALFTINNGTGELSFIAAPDFEDPGDLDNDNAYEVIVTVTDNGTGTLTDTQALSVAVTDANDAPIITSNGGGATGTDSVVENTTAVTNVTATDADLPAQELTFSISGDDAALFTINDSTGELGFLAAPDFETPGDLDNDNVYEVTVTVTDDGTGTLTDTQALSISVTNGNDAPMITSNGGSATGTDSVAENTTAVTTVIASDEDEPAQELTYSISGGDDAALFTINNGTGALSFIAAPDFENPGDLDNDNAYEVIVAVTDDGTGDLTDSQSLSVTVTDANEAPVITSNGGGATGGESIVENATAVTTVTTSDEDEPAQELTFSISGDDAALFTITDGTGELSFLAAPDYENPGDLDNDNEYEVIVTVTDNGTGTLTDAQALTVTVTDGNDAPSAIEISASMVAENAGEDVVVGTLSAVDEDNPANGQTHVFSLVSGTGDTDNASFTIENGQLKTTENFDFETKPSYTIRVQAADDGMPEASYEQALIITVGNVDIAVADPDGRDLEDGVSDAYVFTDPQMLGTSSSTRYFTISNPGTVPLTGIEVMKDGIQSGSFTLDTSGTADSLEPGETTTFAVTFAPTYYGAREAFLQIANDEDEESPFNLSMTGTGTTLVATLAGGTLTISDPADRADALTIATSGPNLVLTAAGGALTTNAGTGNGTNVVTIPLASVTNGIVVNIGLGGGTVTFGDMTGYTGPLTATPVVSGDLSIRVAGPVHVGAHAINFTATKTVTISDRLQATGTGSITVSAGQGLVVNSAAAISVENGNLSLSANQALPAQDGSFNGIDVSGASTIGSTATGEVTLNGKSGAAAGHGVEIEAGSVITGGVSGVLTINGVSNAPGANRYGVHVTGAGTKITSLGANIVLNGQGAGTTTRNHGVVIASGANVLAVAAANLSITGTGGVEGQGVRIRDDAAATLVAVVDGDLTITGNEGSGASGKQGFHYTGGKSGRIESTGTGDLFFVADSLEMTGAGTSKGIIQTTGTGSLTFKPATATTSIGLGGGAGSLSLTDAALAYFGDGFSSITIGDTAAGSGNITINTATFSDPVLLAGGTIYNAGGADVTLTAGDTLTLKGTVAPGASPGKLTVSGKAALAANSVVQLEISGLIAGTQNDQIIASETVDIGSNATLNLVQVGGFIPTGTESFTLIQRTNGTGTFNGMPEGHVFTNLFGSGQAATLTYLAGSSGKDVALVMGALIPDINIEQPVGTELVDGLASIPLGKAAVTKRGITKTFTVTNTGTGAVTDLALSLSGANAADFAFSSLSTTTLADGASTTFSVTFTPSALGTRTALLRLASNVNGSKNPFDITLTGTGIATEAAKPTLVITSPAASAKMNEGAVSVAGTVKDASGIALVEVKLGTGAWVEAALNLDTTGTSGSYSLALSPVPGLNSLSVRATDTAGNVTTTTRSFTYVVLRSLTLATAGSGYGTVAFTSPTTAVASSLQLANRFTLRATAAAGSFFNGWSSPNGSITIASPLVTTLTFTMVEGAEITANFISNPFTTDLTGSYAGLIKAATGTTAAKSNTGLFTARLTSMGSFTGAVNLDGVTKPVSGTFNPNTGNAIVSVLNGATTWSLSLHLDLSGGTDLITGTLTQVTGGIAGDVSDITAERAAFSATATVPVANRGTYTVVLPARTSQADSLVVYPLGDGVGQLTVAASGTVSLIATLADGRAITSTGALSQNLTWPVFVSFTSRAGSLAGVATLDAARGDSDVSATDLAWYLNADASTYFPAGWPNGIKTDLVGALYSVPVGSAVLPGLGSTNASTGNAALTFSSGNLGSTLNKNVNITSASVVSRAPTADSTFSIALTKTSGAFSGTFTHDSGGKASYRGTLLQKGANAGGYGYFLLAPAASGNAGAVMLNPK